MIPAKRGLSIYRCVATMSCSNGVWGCASASMMAMGLPPNSARLRWARPLRHRPYGARFADDGVISKLSCSGVGQDDRHVWSRAASVLVLRGQRLNMLLTRVLSLRIIVIVAALSVVALVITLGAWVWFGVTNDQYSQLDRRLDSVSSLGDISTLLRTAQDAAANQPVPNGGLVRTALVRNAIASVPSDIVLPQFGNGYANTTINGVEYRVRTFSAGVASIAVGAPLAETQNRLDELNRRGLLVFGGGVVGTPFVGGGCGVISFNPLRGLAHKGRALKAPS